MPAQGNYYTATKTSDMQWKQNIQADAIKTLTMVYTLTVTIQ